MSLSFGTDLRIIFANRKSSSSESFEFSIESIRIGQKYQIRAADDWHHIEYIEYYSPDEWTIAGCEIIDHNRHNRKEFNTFLKAVKIVALQQEFAHQTALTMLFKKMNNKHQKDARFI
jgi:hypothetical protein